MKVYAAIGHFKDSKNTTSVAIMQNTKKDFMADCYGNDFVPYVVITEAMFERLREISNSGEAFALFDQVKKLTTNYRVWDVVTEYIEQCFDLLEEKMQAARENY